MPDSSHKLQEFGEAIDKLFKVVGVVIATFLGVIIFFAFLDVILHQFNLGFVWDEEIACICFIYLVYLGSIMAAYENRRPMINTMVHKVPPRAQKVLYVAIQDTIIRLMGALATDAFQDAWKNRNDFWITTHFPVFMVHFAGVLLGVSAIIISLVNLCRVLFLKESVLELSGDHGESNVLSDDGELGEGVGL